MYIFLNKILRFSLMFLGFLLSEIFRFFLKFHFFLKFSDFF